MTKRAGIYVEIHIHAELDEVWRLTQDPALHQRWDLRFSRIEYLPRASDHEPQHFRYETRIGFGMRIRGTGESVGQRSATTGDTTSSLRFYSDDPKSLIESGSGYWRYIPQNSGVRFLTWYDYTVRLGALGRWIDRTFFRPLIGWATAWSFDCLRLWAEDGQTPQSSISLAGIHAGARIALAVIWIWHGLIPKLLFHHPDEQNMLRQAHVYVGLLPWIGSLEILFGLALLIGWHWRWLFLANILAMVMATAAVTVSSPEYLKAAFNPVTLNLAVVTIALLGWIASANLPSSRRCLRAAKETG